jgi:hypothetical protein
MESRRSIVAFAIEMIDPAGIDRRGAALDTVNSIAALQQKLGEIGAVLPGDPGNERNAVRHNLPQIGISALRKIA